MNAAEALQTARGAAVRVSIDGDDLMLEASAPPAASVLEIISRHKAGIVALLRSTDDRWSAEDWHVFFDERAGILEFDGGLSRGQAEAHAFGCCVVEWLIRNPACLVPGRCLACGDSDHADDPLLPLDSERTSSVWIHSGCWAAWGADRQGDAVAALAAMGIAAPAEFPNHFGKNGET